MLAVGIGGFAGTRGRNIFLWSFISLLITPVASAGILLLLKDLNPAHRVDVKREAETE